jgi:hypothetical protein
MKTRRFLIVFVMGFGLLAACQPITAETLAGTGGESVQVEENMGSVPVAPKRVQGAHSSYSGDDAYDPAAGGLSLGQKPSDLIREQPLRKSGGFSGDDAYDPAAGGLSLEQKSPAVDMEGYFFNKGSYSGDDPYDPAAGGLGFYK